MLSNYTKLPQVLARSHGGIPRRAQKLNATLRQKQQDLELAQDVGKIGNWRLSLQDHQLHWSAEIHVIFGIPQGTPLTYESFLACVHPDDLAYVDRKWQAALQGELYDIEHRIIVAEQVKWVREKAILEFDRQGQLLGGFGVAQDITQQKQRERLEQESQQRFASIIKSALDGIITIDAQQRILQFNPSAEKIFGYSAAAMIGESLDRLIPMRFHESHAAQVRTLDASATYGYKSGELLCVTGRRASGEEFPLETSISSHTLNGVKLFTAILRDVSERIQTQQQLEALVERYELVLNGAHDGIWDWDIVNKRVHRSRQWKALRGFTPDEVGDREVEWSAHIHPDDKPRVLAALQAHLGKKAPLFCAEYRMLCKDGSWKWIADQGIAKRDTTGKVIRMAGSQNDITARKLAEAALIEHEAQIRFIMDATPAFLALLDTDFRYLRINKMYTEWFGLTEEVILGRHVREIVGDAAWQFARKYRERALAGEQVQMDVQIPFHVDSTRWVQVTYTPHKDSKGEVKGILLHAVDIEDRVMDQQKISALNLSLQQRVEELQTIFDTAPVGLSITDDTSGLHLRGNQAIMQLLGLPLHSELSKKSPNTPYRVFQNGTELAVSDLPMQRAICGEAVKAEIVDILRADGQIITVQASASPLFCADGKPRGAVGVFIDITALKATQEALQKSQELLLQDIEQRKAVELTLRETEQRMRLATEATGVGLWEWNTLTNKVTWDSQMFVIYGVTPTHDFVVDYQTWSAALVPEDLVAEELIWQNIAHCEFPFTREFRIIHRLTGEERHINAVHTVRLNHLGQPEWVIGTNLDITAQKRALQAVQASETRLQLGIEVGRIGLAEVDYRTGINHLSAGAAKLLGLGEKAIDLPRAEAHQLVHPEDRAEMLRLIQEALDPEKPTWQFTDYRVIWPNGEIHWLRMCHQIEFIPATQQPLRAILAVHDITDEKNALEDARNREAFVSSILNSLPQHIAVLDQQGVIFMVNEPWDRFACTHEADLNTVSLGVNYLEVCRQAAATGDKYATAAFAGLEALISEQQQNFLLEYECHTPTSKHWFLMQAQLIAQGAAKIIVSHLDITDFKLAQLALAESNARLALIIEEVNAGYWDWDLVTNKVYFSTEWKQQLGLAADAPLNHWHTWENLLHPDDQAMFKQTFNSSLTSQQTVFEMEYRLLHQDGSYRWIHTRASMLRDQYGLPYRLLGINLDISDYRQRQEINARRDKMEQTFRLHLATQTAAAIAHELNQPLAAISNYADVALAMLQLEQPNRQQLSQILENCVLQAQRAGDAIRQLVAVLHRNESICETLDINTVVKEASNIIATDGYLGTFTLELELESELMPVTANNLQIQKVLLNLLHNGLESMVDSGRTVGAIHISTARSTSNPAMAEISVRDCGTGVADSAMLETIFQPFFSTKKTGLGMGLAICRALIEAHDGKLWAEQNVDAGLTIHLTLPFSV